MAKFIIHGSKKLSGEIEVRGAKNEATKIVAASILTDQDVVINNAPHILDFEKMLEIIRSMGGRAEWTGDHQVTLNCKDIDPQKIDQEKVRQLRASVVFIGPMLARFGKIDFPTPGGCIIGNRPMDTHFLAFEQLGAQITKVNDKLYRLTANKLIGNTVVLQEFSVTATENILMAATLAQGETVLKIAAVEPHVGDLVKCLNKMGAQIKWLTNHTLLIKGVEKLSGVEHTVIPDTIEAGTFILLAAVTNSSIKITHLNPNHMDLFLLKLKEFGVNFEVGQDYILVKPAGELKAVKKIETNIYPGIPTDLQQPLAVLATQAAGPTLIFEKMFEGRFKYTSELQKMGANIINANPHQIIITGPTPLYGTEVKTFDLRAGATLIVAGLLADGETIINEAEIVDRGYEDIVGRLQKIGADIQKIE